MVDQGAGVEHKSVCRYCPGACGVKVEVDDSGTLLNIRGDKSHVMSKGYACVKGVRAVEAANGKSRLLRPLKRTRSGDFVEIPLATALDEIAERLQDILRKDGPRAIALFKGTQSYFNVALSQMLTDWMQAIKSPSYFTTMSIDQSAKAVTMSRMGYWDAGRQRMDESDVMMLVGTNPLLSVSTHGYVMFHVLKQMQQSKARGMRLIVIDPRRTETAEYADVFLQPYPGEDAALLAGMLRIVITEGWYDQAFCRRYVRGMDQLFAAVAPFTPSYVEARAGVAPHLLQRAAQVFARDARKGFATTGTGATMAPHSNLSDHLTECLNVICGRVLAEGERVANPGVLTPHRRFRAQVVAPNRSWTTGHQGNAGYGTLNGEMMSATLADEISIRGEGSIKALIVAGGNPAVCLPDQRSAVDALRALELLVAIEPYMTSTAQLCHYVLPPKLQYERADVLFGPMFEQILNPVPFQQYIPAVSTPPPGAEVIDDWYIFWALAKRLKVPLHFAGQPLDMEFVPTTEELLRIMLRDSQITFDQLAEHPHGKIFSVPEQVVEPADPGNESRFELTPPDVLDEIRSVLDEASSYREFTHRLAVRRLRDTLNSLGQHSGGKRLYNPAYLHPEDLRAMRLESGEEVEIQSATGSIIAIVEPDATLRRGVISMSHCWGGLPDDGRDYREKGASTNLLISTRHRKETINAMPWMSGVPVNCVPIVTHARHE
jgi:anaerobic selenocysteine-containing dehydrogenase